MVLIDFQIVIVTRILDLVQQELQDRLNLGGYNRFGDSPASCDLFLCDCGNGFFAVMSCTIELFFLWTDPVECDFFESHSVVSHSVMCNPVVSDPVMG